MRLVPKRPTIRGVIYKEEEKYGCGICEEEYDVRLQARKCLYECVLEQVTNTRIIQVPKKKTSWAFQCSACFREYDTHAIATLCLDKCISEIQARLDQIDEFLGTSVNPSIEAIDQLDASLEAQLAGGENPLAASDELIPPSQAPAAEEASNVTPIDAEEGKFFQDQARYGCKSCNKVYLSKAEVIACFDNHFKDSMDEHIKAA